MNYSRDSLQMKKQLHNIYATADDPDGIRTHVTAVKGRCLNRLTTGPLPCGSTSATLSATSGPSIIFFSRMFPNERPKQGSNL
jgi:hypothetical protein